MIILDASALYPIAKTSIEKLLDIAERLIEEEASILDLTIYEAANAAIVEARRGIIEDPHRLVSAISTLASQLALIRVKPEDMNAISSLADKLKTTVYDAAYTYYTRLYRAKLITSDKEILEKAGDVTLDTREWISKGEEASPAKRKRAQI